MKEIPFKSVFSLLVLLISAWSDLNGQSFNVTVDKAVNGTFQLDPALPADGKYPAGTVVTVTAVPDAGFVLDAGYFSVPGKWGQMYSEFI